MREFGQKKSNFKGVIILERFLTKADLVNSFFNKLKQKNISAKEAAKAMYLAQSTLSMWKEKEAIPDQQLANVAKFLKDNEFSAQVSNYFFGLPAVIEDKTLKTDPLSLLVHLLNAEKKKSSVCDELEEVLNHSDFKMSDRSIIAIAIKCFKNESAIESHLSNLLMDKYNIKDEELHPLTSKFDRYRKQVVRNAIEQINFD